MKIISSIRSFVALSLAAISVTWAAEVPLPPELRGILVTGKEHHFALVASGGQHSGWAVLGETFADWKLVDFLTSEDAIVVQGRDSKRATVRLNPSATVQSDIPGATKATVAQADEILNKMKFEAMWDRIAVEQKKGIIAGIRQQATAEFMNAGLTQKEFDALLEKMGDAVVAGLQSDAMRQDFARIYSEVYTADELHGMSDFYDTAAGRAWTAKQPEVQQMLMQVMMPRVMAGMPAAQKIATDYISQRAVVATPTQTKQ